jgi:membrane associated rhomboid family serine protease
MVMASLGLITAHSLLLSRHEKRVIWLGGGAIAGCLLVVLLGFSTKSDVIAHVGGFISGALLGLLAMRFRNILLRRATNVSSALLCVALVVATWWLASHR